MKLTVGEHGVMELEEVYNSITLRTTEGNEYHISMRDNTIEIVMARDTPRPRMYWGIDGVMKPIAQQVPSS